MGVGGYISGGCFKCMGAGWALADRSGLRPIEVGVDRKMGGGGGALFFQ